MKRKHIFAYTSVSLILLACFFIPFLSRDRADTMRTTTVSTTHPTDLLLAQNLPETPKTYPATQIQLQALHTYADGHLSMVQANVSWSSSNPQVATVTREGLLTIQDKLGQTVILVSDGTYHDRLVLEKTDKKSVKVITEQQGRYDVISRMLANMSVAEKVGQTLMPSFSMYGGKPFHELTPEIANQIKRLQLGGIILFKDSLDETKQIVQLTNALQKNQHKFGLLIGTDQEGGIVSRLKQGTNMPGNMALGATRNPKLAYQAGQSMADELLSLGINLDFAPTVDVNNNSKNPVIGVRSYGENPQLVAEMGTSFIAGMQDAGVVASAKHFPGHGNTSVDSHVGLPVISYGKKQLEQVEFIPFRQAIKKGVDSVLVAHIAFPQLEPIRVVSHQKDKSVFLPATLSPKLVQGLLRREFGYDGLVITDAMDMGGITQHFETVDASIRAMNAGADIILMPPDVEKVSVGMQKAVMSGTIKKERLDEAVRRILTVKIRRGIFPQEQMPHVPILQQIAEKSVTSPAHKQVERAIAEQSITVVKNDEILPLDPSSGQKIAVIGSRYTSEMTRAIQKYHQNTVAIKLSHVIKAQQQQQMEHADILMVLPDSSAGGIKPVNQIIKKLIDQKQKPVIMISTRNPYQLTDFQKVPVYVAQYGNADASFQATAAILFGQGKSKGKLPVTIYDTKGNILYPYGHGL
ncbi:glycoside hydrolase family 3 protein [Brevibacillus laterosporus]|uniref:glycoside hydrolase family 3 protein n=1 Tax=Brevibacillus laterosporus TaxID=1465 RepID=UPI002656C5E6|nr:glycoside hydrolase family 3 protein [Brevibacillus laterosporus]MDN9009583.1 glycoside hydrolase family 3 N-terminal domain-containing protein [Brevibacillus laterosporus]MDO0940418.1 glycoside hydrolase family 3 N-terminal domain-containing protein [Brevibacillus laterosporus]